jgi:site-specific recombinase XerD
MADELIPTIPTSTDTIDYLMPLVLNAITGSDNTRHVYRRHLERFWEWYTEHRRAPLSKAIVREYLMYLQENGAGAATYNQALAVLRLLAAEAADAGLLADTAAIGIDKIKSAPQRGRRTGNWLSPAQARALVVTPDVSDLAGKRDRALLGLLLECGLRRDEAVTVQVEQIQERQERWVLADLLGKGRKYRTVPIPTRCAVKILDWIEAAHLTTGPIIRSIDRHGNIGAGMSTTAAYKIGVRCAKDAGITRLAPHDLRRTFGRLAHANGAKIEQISLTYGHSKISTTERYLGIEQDLNTAPCDAMDIEAGANRKKRK